MSWRVARSLDVLLAELNTAAPKRNKASDGSIGDAAHASRSSDHNPWISYQGVGIVRARDFTHDPAGGLDCNVLAGALVTMFGVHPAMGSGSYVIWQRRIFSFDRRGEGWRYYSGSNPHDHHLHVSVALAQPGFDTTRPWGVMGATEEDDLPYTEKQLKDIVKTAVEELLNEPVKVQDGGRTKWRSPLQQIKETFQQRRRK